MNKPTPGPWDVTGCQFPDDDGDGVYYRVTAEGMDASGANARLIAAAPELLEALEGLLAELAWVNEQLDLMPDDYAEAQNRAAAAIAKARGQ